MPACARAHSTLKQEAVDSRRAHFPNVNTSIKTSYAHTHKRRKLMVFTWAVSVSELCCLSSGTERVEEASRCVHVSFHALSIYQRTRPTLMKITQVRTISTIILSSFLLLLLVMPFLFSSWMRHSAVLLSSCPHRHTAACLAAFPQFAAYENTEAERLKQQSEVPLSLLIANGPSSLPHVPLSLALAFFLLIWHNRKRVNLNSCFQCKHTVNPPPPTQPLPVLNWSNRCWQRAQQTVVLTGREQKLHRWLCRKHTDLWPGL